MYAQVFLDDLVHVPVPDAKKFTATLPMS